jgi:hypothetical protein
MLAAVRAPPAREGARPGRPEEFWRTLAVGHHGLETAAPGPVTVWVGPPPSGADRSGCGDNTSSPCASLRYAVNVVAAGVQPPFAPVIVQLLPGLFNASSCGAATGRPLSVVGAGSSATTIDCGGLNRALVTTASLSLTGLTLVAGAAVVQGEVPSGILPAILSGGGGGAVLALWPTLGSYLLSAVDVRFINNTVTVNVTASAAAGTPSVLAAGGGGLYVSGGGFNSTIALLRCAFWGNAVTVDSSEGTVAACGGGACVLPCMGSPSSGFARGFPKLEDSSQLGTAEVTVQDTTFDDNALMCSRGCTSNVPGCALMLRRAHSCCAATR